MNIELNYQCKALPVLVAVKMVNYSLSLEETIQKCNGVFSKQYFFLTRESRKIQKGMSELVLNSLIYCPHSRDVTVKYRCSIILIREKSIKMHQQLP